jgi:hypothetical protein
MYRAAKLSVRETRPADEELNVQMTAVMQERAASRRLNETGRTATAVDGGKRGGGGTRARKRMSEGLETNVSAWKDKLKKVLMSKYKNDLTSDMEIIYTTSENKQIGSNLLSLINQVLDASKYQDKSHDRDLFIFYSIKHKKIPLHLFERVMPGVGKIYDRMRIAAANMGI